MKLAITPLLCSATILLTACQNVGYEAEDAVSLDICFEGDPSAYNLGRQCAEVLLKNGHRESEIQDMLLDIRAREYNIRTKVGNEAADTYISAFKTRLQESGDTLYNTLFK